MCKVSVLLKSSNCFLHLALPALFYLRQRSHLMPGNDARVRYSLGANVNTPFFQVPTLNSGDGHRVPVCIQFFLVLGLSATALYSLLC